MPTAISNLLTLEYIDAIPLFALWIPEEPMLLF